jgi:enoyl-CoA hydratase
MFPDYQNISITRHGSTHATIAFARPQAANALNKAMAQELADAFGRAGNLRAILLAGNEKHFCAGADLKERKGMDENQWHAQHAAFEAAVSAIAECPAPVIAVVAGAAYGGGLELALAADFIYASEHARFALSETTLGIMPGMGGTQRLPRAVGMARAKELMFTGTAFSAAQAHEWGMVNRVCAPATLMDEALACAGVISANAPLAVRAVKQAVQQGIGLEIGQAMRCELGYYAQLLNSNDRHEGINAFNDKRKPAFTGS